MLQAETIPGGVVIGPPHNADGSPGGGVRFTLDTGRNLEEEGQEINIPLELRTSKQIFTFTGSNADILEQILKLANLSLADHVTHVRAGDVVICVRSAWDPAIHTYTGTIDEILHKVNTSNGCKPIIKPEIIAKDGGSIPELNSKGGYDYSGEEEKIADKVGLVTLPKLVTGTNCSNCIFNQNGFCDNGKVLLPVTSKMCCSYWDDKSFRSHIQNIWKANLFADRSKEFPLNDRGGYDYSGEGLNRAREADLITLPPGIEGTNCSAGNCMYRKEGMCIHPKINLPVTDHMSCSWWDNTEVIHEWGAPVEIQFGEGGPIPANWKKKDWQAETSFSPRWKKKKESLKQLSTNSHKLRLKVNKDLESPDERTFLTALAVAIMDHTAERVGNDDSADNGHFGVTGFRKDHISVVGKKIHLNYVGKSGTKHDKSVSDLRLANALRKAIKKSPGDFVFETSDGFRIKSDKITRYLQPFNISPKDLRGYNANKWIIELLKKEDGRSQLVSDNPKKVRKVRKQIFNKAVKETADRVGHGAATLKKHYMIPELPIEYIENGKIIDMKNIGYYQDGGPLGDIPIHKHFANKNEIPNIVNKATEKIYLEAEDEGLDKFFNSRMVKEVDWKDVVPTQDFLRTSKFNRLENVEDIYSIDLPWAIEYNGKYYINDGHHRAVAMHNRNQPIKVHVYTIDEEPQNNSMREGSEVPYSEKSGDPVIKRLLAENAEAILALEFDDSEMLWDEESDRRFYVKRIAGDQFIIEESGSLGNNYPSVLVLSKQIMAEGGDVSSVEEKITKRLQERQKGKEFKDTGVATYTRKYQAAYDIVTSSDLADIEKDNVTAYKLIEKSKIWPLYNVNELKQTGNTSGAAYLKVKCREFLSARPLDTKEAREVYVKNIEKLRSALASIKTALDVKNYLDQFADLDKMDLGDLSSFPAVSWITSSYTGNLQKYNSRKVEEYFNDIFGKKFYNFCHAKSDTARTIYAEAFLYESYSQSSRDAYVNKKYEISQASLKRYEDLKDKINASAGDNSTIQKLIKESGIPYFEYKYDKQFVLDHIDKYIAFFNTQTKAKIDSGLSKLYTVREDDWSWSSTEKKEAAAPKDEEGKPRKPENIFEKYGIEQPKVLKRAPLSFIKRTGGLEVGDISTKVVLENYGFKNVIYGNYVNDAESKEHTKHILGAMLDMVELCNIDIKGINQLGGLDINIGSTGCGPFSAAAACYYASLKAINLTKKRGDGSLGHEWAHYLDNILSQGAEKKATDIPYATSNPAKSARVTALFSEYTNWLHNGGTTRKITVTYYPQKKFLYRIYGETLPAAIEAVQKRYPAYKEYKKFDTNNLVRYYGYLAYKLNDNKPLEVELETKATNFWVNTSKFSPSDYFLDPQELFARAFEAWLEYKLGKMGRTNNYLVDTASGMGLMALVVPRSEWCYPSGDDVVWLDDWFERLFSAIRVDYDIKPFAWGTKERVDEYMDYKDNTKTEKIDAGVEVSTDGTVTVAGDIEEFEKGYGFRIETLKDAKGINRNIYRLITNPYSRGRSFALGGKPSDVFIFAMKYFTTEKSGYGIADGNEENGLPHIVENLSIEKLEDAKKEAIKYFNPSKESKPKKPMTQESDYQPELFSEGGGIEGMPPEPWKWEDIKKFFEGELPSKLPSNKDKISLTVVETNFEKAPFDSLNIRPISYKLKSIDEPLKNVVGTDELRPAMMGVYYDPEQKQKVATNAHILVVIKDKSITSKKLIDPYSGADLLKFKDEDTKRETELRYPNYMAVIPINNAYKMHLTESQVDQLMDELNGIVRAKRFLQEREEQKIIAKITYQDLDIYVNPVFLLTVLAILKQYGATAIDLEFSSPNRAIMVIDSRKNGNKGLVMPVMYKDDFIPVKILDDAKISAQPEPKRVTPSAAAPAPKKQLESKPAPKTDRKKPNTIHSCAVRLGRKGGKASAKARAQMGEGGVITASDIKKGARFKNPAGTIFIVDKISSYDKNTPRIESSLEGGPKGDYADPLDDFVAFLNEEEVTKLEEGGPADGSENPVEEISNDLEENLQAEGVNDNTEKEYDKQVALYPNVENDETQKPVKGCLCFSSYLEKEKPELVERLLSEDVNSNPELRTQVDEAHMAWSGGKN